MDVGSEPPPAGRSEGGTEGGWGAALWRAALVLLLAWAGFLVIPDRLLAYLAIRVSPHTRDALVTLWVAAFFVALSWLFVALQRPRRRA